MVEEIVDGVPQYSTKYAHPDFEKFGLLFPVNPELHAHDAPVFWHPNRFHSAVRFHVIERQNIRLESSPILLSKYPAKRSYFKAPDGSYHVRFLGPKFWFQLHADNLNLDDENTYIGLDFNHAEGREKRLKTASQLFGIFDGSVALDSPIHAPKRPDLHEKSARVFDMRGENYTWKDIILSVLGADYLENNPEKFESAKQTMRNYYKRARRYIDGDYLRILDQT